MTSDGNTIHVPVNRLGKCLSQMYVFAYFNRFPRCFDANRFRNRVRISAHLTEIQVGDVTCLMSAGGLLKHWLRYRERVAAMYRATSKCTDSPFVRMREEVEYERQLSVTIARYVR